MANIQYADDGIYTVNFYAEDDCGNRTTGVRTINVREKQYTISFDSKGGSVVAAILVNEGDDVSGFATPTKEGVAFKGWYDNPYCYGDPITEIEDVYQNYTLYAKWGEEGYATLIFSDFTLAFNVPDSKRAQYISQHGSVFHEYPPLDAEHDYVWTSSAGAYWADYRDNIRHILIASEIKPTSIAYWFSNMQNLVDANDMQKMNMSQCTSARSAFSSINQSNAPLALDLSGWDMSHVTDFSYMFSSARAAELNLAGWNTAGAVASGTAVTMNSMFQGYVPVPTSRVVDISSFNFSNVTNLERMFYQTAIHVLNIGNPDTSKCTVFSEMFGRSSLNTIYSDDFDRSSENQELSCFYQTTDIVGGNGTGYSRNQSSSAMCVVDKPGRIGYFTMPTTVRIKVYSSPADMVEEIVPTGVEYFPVWNEQPGQFPLGWHFSSSLDDPAFWSFVPTNSCSVYMEYVDAKSLTYHQNNGETNPVITVGKGQTVQLDYTPVKTGYEFAGWYDNASLTGSPITEVVVGNDNIEVWAKWEEVVSDLHVLFYEPGTSDGTLVLSVPDDDAVIEELKGMYGTHTQRYNNTTGGYIGWQNDGHKTSIVHVMCYGSKAVLSPMAHAFYGCSLMQDCNLTGLVVSSDYSLNDQTNWIETFFGCASLQQVSFPSAASYGNVTLGCYSTFEGCSKLKSLPQLPCTDYRGCEKMFKDCVKLEWAQFGQPFTQCVTMSEMFRGCVELESVRFPSTFNPTTLSNTVRMFMDCRNLLTIENLDKLTLNDMYSLEVTGMFYGCSQLTSIDLSAWTFDAGEMLNFNQVFQGCGNVTQIKVPASFNLSTVSFSANNWCYGCTKLVGGQGTAYNSDMASNKAYAKVDGGALDKGLFTEA